MEALFTVYSLNLHPQCQITSLMQTPPLMVSLTIFSLTLLLFENEYRAKGRGLKLTQKLTYFIHSANNRVENV